MIVVLSGGAGGGRFCRGVDAATKDEDVVIIGNTGDDIEVHGLRVCPDLDLITFTLAGILDAKGYGIEGDPRNVLSELSALGLEAWFDLGDRDLGICLARTEMLRAGMPLHEVTAAIASRFDLRCRPIPMTDATVWTQVTTSQGPRHFQRWWVQERARDQALSVEVVGIGEAAPAPGVLEAIAAADAILFAPSNPIVSIGPILQVPGIREALGAASGAKVAVTPIVSGAVLRGMADKLLAAAGIEVSAAGVAGMYAGLIDGFVLDQRDVELKARIEALGIEVACVDTIMSDDAASEALARSALSLASGMGAR